MPNTPDPLSNNPDIKKWAQKFYQVKNWSDPDAPSGTDTDLNARRAAASKALAAIPVGEELSAGARRGFSAGVKAISHAIRTQTTPDGFDAIDKDISVLTEDMARQNQIAAARAAAFGALGACDGKFAGVRDALEGGSYAHTDKHLGASKANYRTAKSKGEFDAVTARCKTFAVLCDSALAYSKHCDEWLRATLALEAVEKDAGIKSKISGAREDAKMAAKKAATAGNFDEGRKTLANWQSSLGGASADFAAVAAFEAARSHFHSNHAKTLKSAFTSALDTQAVNGSQGAADQAAYKSGDFALGKKLYEELGEWTTERAVLIAQIKPFKEGEKNFPDVTQMISQVNAHQTKGNIAPAIEEIAKFESDPVRARQYEAFVHAKKMIKKSKSFQQQLKKPESGAFAKIFGTFKGAAFASNAKNTDALDAAWSKLDDIMQLQSIVEERQEMAKIAAKHKTPTPAADYGYTADMDTALAVGNYTAAIAACHDAVEKMRLLDEFLDLKNKVIALIGTLVTPAKETVQKALGTADGIAKAKKPDEALTDLKAFLSGSDYLALSLEISDYMAKKAIIDKHLKKVIKFVADPQIKDALQTPFDAICAKTETTGGSFGDGYLDLQELENRMKHAQAMAAARRQVVNIIAALEKMGPPSADPVQIADAKSKVKDGEALAVKLEFEKSARAFEEIRKSLDGMCRKAAEIVEQADAVGCNAGHSIKRHGPDVTDDALIYRLTHGIPPNAKPGETSQVQNSSRFESSQDWLAGREIAAQAALKLPPPETVDVAQTSMPYDPAASPEPPENFVFTVEHGRPIDRAFVGRKRALQTSGDEGPTSGKSFETYEEMNGLTRAYVKFMWVPAPIEGVPKPTTTDPHNTETVQVDNNAKYVEEYISKEGKPPSNIPGRWVMVQQYPNTEHWDDDLKAYETDDVEGLI